jgi:hypothetical protein
MGELDDSFAVLLGRQASDKEKQALYRVRDALKLKSTDAVWLLLMALQHYQTLYEQFPARIAAAARDVTKTARATAEAEAKAAQEATKRALMAAVHEAAVKSSEDAAGAQLAKWVAVAGGVVCVSLVIVGWSAFAHGRDNGRAVGENIAKRECAALVAASSWANTPDGQLAYVFAKVGGLGEVARCAGRGMVPKDGWCVVPSERGRPLARWPVPASSVRSIGESP